MAWMAACRSSFFFALTRTCSPMTWVWTFRPSPFTNFVISRALSSLIPVLTLRSCFVVPLAAAWTGPTWRAFSGTCRRTSLSLTTSTAAFSRSSVEERTSMRSSSRSIVVAVFLKSNRVETSRRAWSRAFATSTMSTSETTSKEKVSFGMAWESYEGRPPHDRTRGADGRRLHACTARSQRGPHASVDYCGDHRDRRHRGDLQRSHHCGHRAVDRRRPGRTGRLQHLQIANCAEASPGKLGRLRRVRRGARAAKGSGL